MTTPKQRELLKTQIQKPSTPAKSQSNIEKQQSLVLIDDSSDKPARGEHRSTPRIPSLSIDLLTGAESSHGL